MLVCLYEKNIHTIRENSTLKKEIKYLRNEYCYARLFNENGGEFRPDITNAYSFYKHGKHYSNDRMTDVKESVAVSSSFVRKFNLLVPEEFNMERNEFKDRFYQLFEEYQSIWNINGNFNKQIFDKFYWLEIYD